MLRAETRLARTIPVKREWTVRAPVCTRESRHRNSIVPIPESIARDSPRRTPRQACARSRRVIRPMFRSGTPVPEWSETEPTCSFRMYLSFCHLAELPLGSKGSRSPLAETVSFWGTRCSPSLARCTAVPTPRTPRTIALPRVSCIYSTISTWKIYRPRNARPVTAEPAYIAAMRHSIATSPPRARKAALPVGWTASPPCCSRSPAHQFCAPSVKNVLALGP